MGKKIFWALVFLLLFTFSFADFSLVNSEKQYLNDWITSDWFINGFYIYRDTDWDIRIYWRYKKKLDYDYWTAWGGFMNYYACAWFPFVLNWKTYLYIDYKANYYSSSYWKLVLYNISDNSVYKASNVSPSYSPPCYSSNIWVVYKDWRYYFMDNNSNTIFLEVSTGINFVRFNKDSTYSYLGPFSSWMLFYIGANGSRYMRVSNFGLHIYSWKNLILKNSDLLSPNLAFYSWLFSDLENSYSLYWDKYSDYCIPDWWNKVKCIDVISYFGSPEKLPDNLYYSIVDSVFYALYLSWTLLRVDTYAVSSSDFVEQSAVTSGSVLNDWDDTSSNSSYTQWATWSLPLLSIFNWSCPVSWSKLSKSIWDFGIGWRSIFGFKVPEYKPFSNFTCFFDLVSYAFSDVDVPFSDIFSWGRDVLEWSYKDFSTQRWIKLWDVLVIMLIFSLVFWYLYRKNKS